MRYLAIDPGKMCGVAMRTVRDVVVPPGTWEWPAWEAVQFVDDVLSTADSGINVVVESFVPRPGTRTWQPDALEVIGAVRWTCLKYHHEFELQTPAQAKAFSTNEKLKRIGWYSPTKDGHANDAVRHLLLAMVRHGDIAKEDLV